MKEESTGGKHTKTPPTQQEQIEKLLADMKVVLKDGQDLLRTGIGVVRERTISGVESTERIVREKPYQSMGVIFGLGVLVGVLAVRTMTPDGGKD